MTTNIYPDEFITHAEKVGRVVTRFPPEPNGYLHLGHVKAMNIDFGFVDYMKTQHQIGGECILRFDDTNPVVEKEEYFDKIIESVNWMGYSYSKITYTSDYFSYLLECATTLIKNNDAYVCEMTKEEIKESRDYNINNKPKASPYRDLPVERSLRLFEEMINGKHENDTMTLRMKGDLESNNPCMWDMVFYRIRHINHHRTGNKFCIYPTYDFSHCIIDSVEGITHSFCTTEYEIRREPYYWVLDKLNLRKPFVYEFSKLEIENNTLSKRKIAQMINIKEVNDWEDPRLLTIFGLKNRGYSAHALRTFCNKLGITKNNSIITYDKLQNTIRDEMEETVSRRLIVVDPIKLHIVNLSQDNICTAYDFPKYMRHILENRLENLSFEQKNTRQIILTNDVYIDRTSFKLTPDAKFYGLAPGKIIRLKYGPFVKYISHDADIINVEIVEITDQAQMKKIKGILNWVPSNYEKITLRHYDNTVCKTNDALIEPNNNTKDKYQFEKYGFYIKNSANNFDCICPIK